MTVTEFETETQDPARPAATFEVRHGPDGLYGYDTATGETCTGQELAARMSVILGGALRKTASRPPGAPPAARPGRIGGSALREVR